MNRTLATVGLAVCMFITSMSWMIMEIPDLFLSFEFSGDTKWILSIYIIAEVTVLPAAGKFTDVYGPRRILPVGAALFVIGSVMCTFSTGMGMLVAMRAVQGLGAGMCFAVVLTSVGRMYPRSERGHPHEVMTAAFAFGSLYGAAVGYWFTLDSGLEPDISWKLPFYLAAVVMVIGATVAMKGLPRDKGIRGGHDVLGTVFLTVLIGDLMALSQLANEEMDILSVESLLMIVIALVSAVMLWMAETDAKDPMVPKGMNRTQAGCILSMFLAGFCGLGMVQFLMKFMLIGVGVSIYDASLTFLFLLTGGACTSMIGLKKVDRTGIRPWILVGPILVMAGFVIASQTLVLGMNYVRLSLFVLGLGLGCIVTEILCSIQGTTRPEDMGSSTSITMSARFVGILLGAATYTAIVDYQITNEIKSIGEAIGDHDVSWLISHFIEIHDNAVLAFESSIELCCLVAGILCTGIMIVAYLLVGDDDVCPPESASKGSEEDQLRTR